MRAQREKVNLLKSDDAEPDEVMLARAKYQGQLNKYAKFSNKMGLPQEGERFYLDMHGRVVPSKESYLVSEKALRAGTGEYSVQWNIVKSKQYSERFEKISLNTKANQLATQRARNALARRDRKIQKNFMQ